MSITVALLADSHDKESVALEGGFRLSVAMLTELDKLVATGKASSRAAAIKHILKYALQDGEGIGRCWWCGVVDHRLYEGACPHCRKHYHLPEPGQGWLGEGSA